MRNLPKSEPIDREDYRTGIVMLLTLQSTVLPIRDRSQLEALKQIPAGQRVATRGELIN